MNELQKQLVAAYFDWVNNYLSQEVMAKDYGVTLYFLRAMLKEGKFINENHG